MCIMNQYESAFNIVACDYEKFVGVAVLTTKILQHAKVLRNIENGR